MKTSDENAIVVYATWYLEYIRMYISGTLFDVYISGWQKHVKRIRSTYLKIRPFLFLFFHVHLNKKAEY